EEPDRGGTQCHQRALGQTPGAAFLSCDTARRCLEREPPVRHLHGIKVLAIERMQHLVHERAQLQEWDRVCLVLSERPYGLRRSDCDALAPGAVEHDAEQTFAAVRYDRRSDEGIHLCIRARGWRQVAPGECILIEVRAIERAG